ncbi:MAG: chloride channel protein [Deltaproteobacteria bacterium]|nr:chloride channel protein [Deltaproteobacteria bacterium]MCW5801001.1 chloride channel protein [Deltaproteobacteria bacterium]
MTTLSGWRRGVRLAVALAWTAVFAALFAIVFRASLGWAVEALGAPDVVTMMQRAPWWQRIALPVAGGLAVGFLMIAMARLREGAGVGFVMEAIVLGRARLPLARSALQALGAWLAIAAGNSLGREGPLIQAGAAAGEASRRVLSLDDGSARLVLAAGVAAGFAAAYNAPIAAVLFVVEIVTGVLVLEAVVPVMIAVVISTVIVRGALGGTPLYGLREFAVTHGWELLAYAGLGIIAAPVGVMFLRGLGRVDRWWRHVPVPWRPACGAAVCGLILVAVPEVAGNGFEPLSALLDGRFAIGFVAWLLVAKAVASASCVGSGNPGGVFTPTLLLGGCTGTLYAALLHATFGDAVGPYGSYALVGLAAALAATTHAPLMATVLACELSGDWALVVPLVLACACAAGIARRLYIDSVYTAELTRRGLRWRLTLDGRRVIQDQQRVVDVV